MHLPNEHGGALHRTADALSFPPPAQPAPHSRIAFTRESSLSPARAASQRRFSHSRGRPRGIQSASTERSTSRSTDGWHPAGSDAGVVAAWRARSESRDGSRAPLWRGVPFSTRSESRARGGNTDEEKARLEEDALDSRDDKGPWFARLARHFRGVRDDRSFPTPLIRPLRHLGPANESYLLGFFGSFPSILIACGISYGLSTAGTVAFATTPLTIGSLGATAVLLYAVPEAPLSQPRNLVGGHVLSALSGAIISQLFALSSRFATSAALDNTLASDRSWGSLTPVAGALSVSIAILAMQITGTIHPPGGATALLAAYHRTTPQRWTFVLDITLSVIAMGVWAMLINNLGRRRYPTYWWKPPPPDDAAVNSPKKDPTPLPSPPFAVPGEEDLRPQPTPRKSGSPPLTPAEDLERRWLGRLGEVDEEALADGDEAAAREEARWHAEEEKRGRRSTRQ